MNKKSKIIAVVLAAFMLLGAMNSVSVVGKTVCSKENCITKVVCGGGNCVKNGVIVVTKDCKKNQSTEKKTTKSVSKKSVTNKKKKAKTQKKKKNTKKQKNDGTTTNKKSTSNKTSNENIKNTEEDQYVERIVELVNQERLKAGLAPVSLDETLNKAAMTRAKETVTSFSHTRPNGTSFSTVLSDYKVSYRGAGENIAWGQATPEEVMNGWMNSSGHRANILNASFKKIGVGYYKAANGRKYWSQLFIF